MQLMKRLNLFMILCILFSTQAHAAPQDEGSWSSVVDWPTIAIHSVLTPQGKVMNFGTDENGAYRAQFSFDVWDPSLGTGASSHNTLPNTIGVDFFCSAAVLMPETGNILISGGNNRTNGDINRGINDALIYNTQNESLRSAADMGSARWYPTSTVLTNGDVLLSGGINAAGQQVTTPEVYSPATNQWRSLLGISTAEYSYYYPRQWLAPNGLVFGYTGDANMYYMNPNGNGSLETLGELSTTSNLAQGAAVMYQPGKILQVGGSGSTSNEAFIIDINGETPSQRAINKPAEIGRVWVESVVLPDGKVMIVGGSAEDNQLVDVSYRPEIWDPNTETWALMAPSVKARLYHSTSLLLKDGRVMVAGGGSPGPQVNTNAEIFSPPYLFDDSGQAASRPTIVSAPIEAPYGSKVPVRHNVGDVISRVTLIKMGATTHSNNMEQRFLELDFESTNLGVNVTLPSSANLAPPGYYLLHLIDNKGVPSEAHVIRISSTALADVYPTSTDDNISSTDGSRITIDPLANDLGFNLTLDAPNVWSQKGGNVVLDSNKITYKPKAGFNGVDKVWYVFRDDLGRSNSGAITITVSGNDGDSSASPVSSPDNVTIAIGGSITIDVLANDTGNGLVLDAPNPWSLKGGTVKLVSNKLVYEPKVGFVGSDNIWYRFVDSQGRSNSGQVNIKVNNELEAVNTLIPYFRLYNPSSQSHFYTQDTVEYAHLGTVGWKEEGIGYYFYDSAKTIDNTTAKPWYRLYNPQSGTHFWTLSELEKDSLDSIGWRQEGIAGYFFESQVPESIPLYRLYNASIGRHHWTKDGNENNLLITQGWKSEGVAGYVFTSQ